MIVIFNLYNNSLLRVCSLHNYHGIATVISFITIIIAVIVY